MTDTVIGTLIFLWLCGFLTGLLFRFVVAVMHRSTRT